MGQSGLPKPLAIDVTHPEHGVFTGTVQTHSQKVLQCCFGKLQQST